MRDLIRRFPSGLFILGSALLLSGGAQAATRSYIVTDFDSVRLEAPIAVAIETRRGTTARGEGDGDLLERIELNVADRVLTIRLKRSPFEGTNQLTAGTARLLLTAPKLRALQLVGAGTLAADGLDARRAEIVAAGSGTVSVAGIASDNLAIAQMGSGTVRLAGKAGSVVTRLSGSGALDAAKLTVADLDLTAEGAASADILATRAAKIVAIGPGAITVEGHPACTVRHAGSGTVVCGGETF